MKITVIESNIFLAFCLLFFVVGAFFNASTGVFLHITATTLAAYAAFNVRIFSPNVTAHSQIPIEEIRKTAIVCLAIIIVGHTLLFTFYGVPALAENPEITRMEPVRDAGIPYRLLTQTIYFAIVAFTLMLFSPASGQVVPVITLFILFVLVYASGFRSRLVDCVALIVVTILLYPPANSRLKHRKTLTILAVGLGAFAATYGLTLLTKLRFGTETLTGAFEMVLHRTFILNYEVNLPRIYDYTAQNGFSLGSSYLMDVVALVTPADSMQQIVTSYFNRSNSDLFIMTPTFYGETYYNFGGLSPVFAFFIVLAYRMVLRLGLAALYLITKRSSLHFIVITCLCYLFPRLAATGGLSNALLIRALSIFLLAVFIHYVVAVIPARKNKNAL